MRARRVLAKRRLATGLAAGLATLALAVGGCTTATRLTATGTAPLRGAMVEARAPVTILVSIDGFRPDYLNRGVTPTLSRLAAGGVSAAMRPSFPSITFPNHWTLVTGLVPDHTGIVGNAMDDARRPNDHFTMQTDDPFWWNTAEPIWVTAEKAGIRTATMFWPGANVAWGGVRPPDAKHGAVTGGIRPENWQQFNQAVTSQQRVEAVVDWMRRPATTRPRFVTLYFDVVDTAGHEHGPDSPEVTAAAADVDRAIGQLVAGLRDLGQPANLVIVADHGMAATSSERVVALDRIAPAGSYKVEESGTFASLYPVPGHEAELAAALSTPRPHLQCWRKEAIPARLRYGTNPRIPPWFCLAEVGWLIEKTTPAKPQTGGGHGYDNDAPAMRALFIANGPAFRHGIRLATFDNVDVAPLLRDLLGLPPGRDLDGDDAPFRQAMAR
jgi:predicted AlkP superfamily pyrophosphatase or phosphodiesterase